MPSLSENVEDGTAARENSNFKYNRISSSTTSADNGVDNNTIVMHKCKHIYTYTYSHVHVHTHIHACMRTYTYIPTRMHIFIHIHR